VSGGGAGFTIVEGAQKGIVFRFGDDLRAHALGDDARQGALAHPDRAFYRDIARQFEQVRHSDSGEHSPRRRQKQLWNQ
jgi:hypothetical protein